jgi:hypothetical protein
MREHSQFIGDSQSDSGVTVINSEGSFHDLLFFGQRVQTRVDFIGLASLAEKGLQHGAAIVMAHARSDFTPVVEPRVLKQVHQASSRPVLRGCAPKNNAIHPRVHKGTGAHRAGFLGHVQLAIGESPIANGGLGLGDGQNFGVRSGVLELFHLIVGACDHAPFEYHNRANRNLFLLPSPPRHAQSLAHEEFVAL